MWNAPCFESVERGPEQAAVDAEGGERATDGGAPEHVAGEMGSGQDALAEDQGGEK